MSFLLDVVWVWCLFAMEMFLSWGDDSVEKVLAAKT